MKNLKIKDKLLIGMLGQVLFGVLIIYFFFNLNYTLNSVTQQRTKSIEEVNKLRELTSLFKDYFHKEVSFSEMEKKYQAFENESKNTAFFNEFQGLWGQLNQIKELIGKNEGIDSSLMDLTGYSLDLSDTYIKDVSTKLANPSLRNTVSVLERMVIIGANVNSYNNHKIRELFLRVKEDISNKESLFDYLKKTREQSELDRKKLENTPYIGMVENSVKTNIEIEKLSLQYIKDIEEMNSLINEVTQTSNNIIQEINQHDLEETASGFNTIKTSFSILLVVILIIIALVIAFNFTTSRLITNVFRLLTADLTSISKGDLNIAPPVGFKNRKDEVGTLARAFITLVINLKEILGSVVAGADNIANASEQLSATAQQISQSSTEQASSVEEVSSTMEEMVSNIEQNSDNAQVTEKISATALGNIVEVGDQSKKSLGASKIIADKIQIINEIAFQTNILALNAAVEAARAGEHGKGFAVVASEVRKLAERSKVAADDIVDLAQSSVQLAEGAGKRMEETQPDIEKTTELVKEIANASLEQKNGVNQINNAIQQLNEITQQNAAGAEETSASAEELASQAVQLKAMVSFFKLNGEGDFHKKTDEPEIGQSNYVPVSKSVKINKKLKNNGNGVVLDLTENKKLVEEFEKY